MAKIIICCGKIASGKTTFCKKIEKEHGVFIFNADEWMMHFFGEAPDCSVFHNQLEKCITMIYRMADRLLERGIDVAFDFGFWTKKDRDDCIARFDRKLHSITVVYFPVDDQKQIENIHKRQEGNMENTFAFTEEKLQFFNKKFEEPQDFECVRIENFML
ncbi:MAG TPA: ATP-binding protein [Treponemataceae bacterium]|jgi:predicted kinase|nr:ATP-binding protein [Treponemataceae bacterium]